MTAPETPNAWRLPFTVADQSAIDALDPDTRALVERYRASSGSPDTSDRRGDLRSLKDDLDEIEGSIRDLRWKVADALEAPQRMKQVVGRWPATERVFVPDVPKGESLREREHVVSRVRVVEMGLDAEIEIWTRGAKSGRVNVPRKDEEEILRRLFGELASYKDRHTFQLIMDQLEDAIVAGDAEARTLARRQLLAALDTIARDLETLSGMPPHQQEKSA
jgi:hypothetical protein